MEQTDTETDVKAYGAGQNIVTIFWVVLKNNT